MNKILVVVDMQSDFIGGSLGTAEARAIVKGAADYIRSFDGDVFATKDTHFSDYLQTREGQLLPVPHCIKGTAGHDIHADILSALKEKGCRVVEKNTFGSVELAKQLQMYGETPDITLIGLCTDICVVSNALLLKAYFPEGVIRVLPDLCAGVTPEKHKSALDVMSSCHILV